MLFQLRLPERGWVKRVVCIFHSIYGPRLYDLSLWMP